MTEITQFNGKYVMHEGMFIYSCAPCNIDFSGRYVRESDYAVLLKRHRRLVADYEALKRGVLKVDELIAESRGVCGLHMNGDEAPWEELRRGGRFEEWLMMFDTALDLATGEAALAEEE